MNYKRNYGSVKNRYCWLEPLHFQILTTVSFSYVSLSNKPLLSLDTPLSNKYSTAPFTVTQQKNELEIKPSRGRGQENEML